MPEIYVTIPGQGTYPPPANAVDPWAAFPTEPPKPAPSLQGKPDEWAAFPTEPPKGTQEATAPAKTETSPSQQMLADYANQQMAASQGTTPVISALAPHLLGQATADELGNIGYKDEQGQFVPTDRNKHVVLLDPADNTYKVYYRTQGTDEGRAAGIGRMAGTMMGPGNIMTSSVLPAVSAAQRIGVDLPRAIATQSPTLRLGGQVALRAPGGGPLQQAIPQSLEQLGGKVQEAAEMAGGRPSAAIAGEGFKGAMGTAFEPATNSLLEQAYGGVQRLINPNQTQSLNHTRNAVGTIAAERYAGAQEGTGKAVGLVLEGINRPEGLTFEGIKRLRNSVGKLIQGGELAKQGYDESEMNRIYAALSDDLRTLVIDSGGPRAAIAYQRAEGMTRGIKAWTEQLRKVIGPKTRAGEGVYEALARMAQSGSSADRQTLAGARAAVPREVWQDVASTVISGLGKNRAGEFSPNIFINDWQKLSNDGKRILFGATGSGGVIPFLDDIAQVSNAFKEAGKLANTSGTASHTAFIAMLGAMGGAIGTAAATGSLKPLLAPVAAIAAVIPINIMARMLATPATAASMSRWARVYQAVAERPTPAGIAAFQRTSGELANTVNGIFGTRLTPAQIMHSTIQGPGTGQADENQQQIPRPPGQ